jgi:hypothetical protein
MPSGTVNSAPDDDKNSALILKLQTIMQKKPEERQLMLSTENSTAGIVQTGIVQPEEEKWPLKLSTKEQDQMLLVVENARALAATIPYVQPSLPEFVTLANIAKLLDMYRLLLAAANKMTADRAGMIGTAAETIVGSTGSKWLGRLTNAGVTLTALWFCGPNVYRTTTDYIHRGVMEIYMTPQFLQVPAEMAVVFGTASLVYAQGTRSALNKRNAHNNNLSTNYVLFSGGVIFPAMVVSLIVGGNTLASVSAFKAKKEKEAEAEIKKQAVDKEKEAGLDLRTVVCNFTFGLWCPTTASPNATALNDDITSVTIQAWGGPSVLSTPYAHTHLVLTFFAALAMAGYAYYVMAKWVINKTNEDDRVPVVKNAFTNRTTRME